MPKLVLIPGLMCDAALWQPTLQEFKNNYHSEIVSINSCSEIEQFSHMLSQKIRENVVLIGFSMGAWIALSLFHDLKNYIKGLILISSAPGSLKQTTKDHLLSYIHLISSGHFEAYIHSDYEQDISAVNKDNQGLKTNLLNMMRRQGAEVAIRQLNALLECKNNFRYLKEIDCPTLLIRGADDKSINTARQEQILLEICNAELSIIPDAAHYIPLENPRAMASVLNEWLLKNKFCATSL